MDRFEDFQIYEVGPALEGFRDFFKGVVDRFKTAKVNKGYDPDLKVPATIKNSTMTRSKSDVAAPSADKYSELTNDKSIMDKIGSNMLDLVHAGVTQMESFGIFGKGNLAATFWKFNDTGDNWISDKAGHITMDLYRLASRLSEIAKKNATMYRIYLKTDRTYGIQLSSNPVSDPSKALYDMMERFIDYKGGGNINIQDHAQASESALDASVFHQDTDDGQYSDATEAFTVSMEAFTNAGKKYEAAVAAMGGNSQLIANFIQACQKAGVKFASPEYAQDAIRNYDRAQAVSMAMAVGYGSTTIQSILKVAGTAVGIQATTKRWDRGKNSSIMIVPLNKKGKERVYTITMARIGNMLNDDNRTFDMEKVAKKAKFIMKHADSGAQTEAD